MHGKTFTITIDVPVTVGNVLSNQIIKSMRENFSEEGFIRVLNQIRENMEAQIEIETKKTKYERHG